MGEVLPQLEYEMRLLNSHSQEMDRGSLKGAGCLTEAKTIENSHLDIHYWPPNRGGRFIGGQPFKKGFNCIFKSSSHT